jgi:hypothetical protein
MSSNEDILKAICANSQRAFNERNGLPPNNPFEVVIIRKNKLETLCADSKAEFNRRNGTPNASVKSTPS